MEEASGMGTDELEVRDRSPGRNAAPAVPVAMSGFVV